jgi:broad specificity phosphatase PhoE
MFWYFVRHGETEWNLKGLFQGATDIPLDDTGRAQAREAGDRVKSQNTFFEKVISSPLGRAIETAELISGISRDDERFIIDDRIREMSFGELEGTDYYSIKNNHGLLFRDPGNYVPECGEETYDSIMSRTVSFLDDMKKKYGDGEGNILIQTHGACMRAMLLTLRGLDISEYWKLAVGNCEFFVFEVNGGIPVELDAGDINPQKV